MSYIGKVAYDANEQVIEIDQAAYDAEVARLEVELTAEEISQREAEEAEWNAGAFDRAMADLRSR